jgi:membrane protease YdiL (CAAX protease family)
MTSADFDDEPDRPPLSEPALPADAAARADYGEPVRYVDPPRRPGFGFWMAVLWSVLYVIVSQVVIGIVAGVPIFLVFIFLVDGGMPEDLNGWMQGPVGRMALLTVVSATQFGGLALSLLLLRFLCGKSWKRKIALTRLPSPTHAALVLIGFPAMIALSAAVEVPLSRYVPNLGEVLKELGIPFDLKGSNEAVSAMVQHAPWALAIFAVAVSPGICEEMFCRGFLAQGLSGRYQTWVVVLAVSFLFGAIHLDPQQGIGAMLLGAVIHGAYLATRSLVVAMAIHFANNGLAVVHYNESLFPVLTLWEGPFERQPLLFVLAGLGLFAAVVYALYQTRCRLAPAVEGLQGWQPEGVSGVELPPPNSGTVVTHEPLSPVSAALVAVGALGFGVMLVLA